MMYKRARFFKEADSIKELFYPINNEDQDIREITKPPWAIEIDTICDLLDFAWRFCSRLENIPWKLGKSYGRFRTPLPSSKMTNMILIMSHFLFNFYQLHWELVKRVISFAKLIIKSLHDALIDDPSSFFNALPFLWYKCCTAIINHAHELSFQSTSFALNYTNDICKPTPSSIDTANQSYHANRYHV